MDSKGYYAIQVSEDVSFQEIKRAYRRLARKYHPDRNNSSFAEDMIKKINASFEVLYDKDKRAEYDKTGIDNERSTKVDACNAEHDDTMTEREQTNSFNNYYHESDSSKASSLYKDSGNYTIRGTSKNARNKVVTVEMQNAEMMLLKRDFI